MDVAHVHKPSALKEAVVTHRDRGIWPDECQQVPGDDVIHVLPKQLDPAAEVRACMRACMCGRGCGCAHRPEFLPW